MTSWKTYKVGDIIDEIAMGPFGSNIKVDNFIDFGVPVLNGANLQGFKLKEESFNYVSLQKADSLGKANAYRGDIVITHRGTLGQIVYIPQNSKFERYVISQSQFRIKLNPKFVLPEYFVYYFHTRLGQLKLLMNASQVGVPALARPTSTFKNITIELPSLEEQRRIAGILGAIDDKIENNRRINTNLELQAQALYKQWFVDNRSEDWETLTLDDVAAISAGGDKPQVCSEQKTQECNIPIYSNSIDREGLYGYTNNPRIIENSITISARGTIGYVCLRTEPYVPIVRLISVIPTHDNMSAYFLYLWALTQNISGTGTTQQQLTVPAFRTTKIVVPSQEILIKFNKVVKPIFDSIKQYKKENITLATLRDTLLPKLMNGEIKI